MRAPHKETVQYSAADRETLVTRGRARDEAGMERKRGAQEAGPGRGEEGRERGSRKRRERG